MQTNLEDIIVGVEQTINAEYEKKEKSATDKKHYALRDKTSGNVNNFELGEYDLSVNEYKERSRHSKY
ncbi:unnamed protein product [Rhizophagus irregularis]|nr:unnamed protein product [Rhizophagus irregularis]